MEISQRVTLQIYYTFAMGNFLHIPADYEIKIAIKRAVKCFEKGGLYTEEVSVLVEGNRFEKD